MADSNPIPTQGSSNPVAEALKGFSPRQWLKSKRISYLTLPLLIMATITEFIILATGWKYQQVVCLPAGMGVTFFGIGPIGATILGCELLKLPLAIWTASRHGWTKMFMVCCGLPMICILTFQLVKDMAVYEMGVALQPAMQFLDVATKQEDRIAQLNAELATLDQKKANRDRRLAELSTNQAKAKGEIEEALKKNDASREDAVNLTDYQKKELTGVEERETAIIKQFDADTAQITKTLADLRAQRETALTRASEWNAEEARIDNEFKKKMADYQNKKAAYVKAKDEYDNANFLKRQLLKEPIDPGVAPVREVDTILKPVELDELDKQIKGKQDELAKVNNQRRDRIAQVEADAHQMREEYDHRSTTKRDEVDKKHDELLAAEAALTAQGEADAKAIDTEYEGAAKTADSIRAELETCKKAAEQAYLERENSIRKTQVHRIATTVEIVRGLIKGERPMSIKMTAKERGDILTDQISMVRIWVYPVLAFIVAFLPTLMVEIGFSTVFEPEQTRPQHRFGFMGRHMHELYIRAGRVKMLRAERLATQAAVEINTRDRALAAAKENGERALQDKEAELQATRDAVAAANAAREQALAEQDEQHAVQLKTKEEEWVAKLASMADSLNRTVIEKDALRDLQKSEIERQIQMRQNAWSDRLSQLRQELDDQRAAAEAERTAMMQDHHRKLMETSEDSKSQVNHARRQAADAELAAMEANAKLKHDLKEALQARELAEAQLKRQADSFALKLSQATEDANHEAEKAIRQEKHRVERQQLELGKTLRQREQELAHEVKQREQELSLSFETRMAEQQARLEDDGRRREADLERRFEARSLEAETRWKQELEHQEEAAQIKIKQLEQQAQAQAEARMSDFRMQAEQDLRRVEAESQRQLEAQSREAAMRLKHELQQKELAYLARLKQREQELSMGADAREAELQTQAVVELKAREEEVKRQAEARIAEAKAQAEQELRRIESEFQSQLETQSREAGNRIKQELQQKEAAFQGRLKEREAELAALTEARMVELQSQWAVELQAREEQWSREADARAGEARTLTEQESRRQFETQAREVNNRLRQEFMQKETAFQTRLKDREKEITAEADARVAQMQQQWETDLRARDEETKRLVDARVTEAKAQAGIDLRRVESEMDRRLEAQSREANARLKQELQQKELTFQAKLKEREQELTTAAEARVEEARAHADALETELKSQAEEESRRAQTDLERRLETQAREASARLKQELQQKDEQLAAKLRQTEQQWQTKLESARTDLQAQHEDARRRRETEFESRLRNLEAQFRKEAQQKEEAAQVKTRQREQELEARLTADAEARLIAAQSLWQADTDMKIRAVTEPLKSQLSRAERERDEALESFNEGARHVEHLEKKLSKASSLLTGNRTNGRHAFADED